MMTLCRLTRSLMITQECNNRRKPFTLGEGAGNWESSVYSLCQKKSTTRLGILVLVSSSLSTEDSTFLPKMVLCEHVDRFMRQPTGPHRIGPKVQMSDRSDRTNNLMTTVMILNFVQKCCPFIQESGNTKTDRLYPCNLKISSNLCHQKENWQSIVLVMQSFMSSNQGWIFLYS